jgi:hypothetical protein
MWRTAALCLLLVSQSSALALTVGVLEHPQCDQDQTRIVRPLFRYGTDGWSSLAAGASLDKYPSNWLVVGSRPEPPVRVRLPEAMPALGWTHARDFSLSPIEVSTLPLAPNLAQAYAGWCDPPKNRPILLVSGSTTVAEYRGAQPKAPPPMGALRRAFLKSLPEGKLCVNYDDRRPTKIRESDLRVRHDIVFPGNMRLIGLSLKRQLTECGSEIGGVEQPRWFVLERSPRFIGASLTHVATADLDGDGEPEHVFWFTGYNEDGYILFRSNFRQPLRFTWKYH